MSKDKAQHTKKGNFTMNTSILKLEATVIRPKDFDELDGLAASLSNTMMKQLVRPWATRT